MHSMTQQQNRIAYLMGDLGWRGALTIFLSDRYCDDARIWRHVNLEEGIIDWPAMFASEYFSHGERLMVGAACSLYTFHAPVLTAEGEEMNAAETNLWGLAARLDEENFTILLRALAAAGSHPVQWVAELR